MILWEKRASVYPLARPVTSGVLAMGEFLFADCVVSPVGGSAPSRSCANPRRAELKSAQLKRSRFIVGVVLVVAAVLMFLFAKGDYSTAGAVAIGVLGLISMAISRRK